MAARPLPPLNALRAFEAAARLGSLSRAAVELHVTHGAVSRQIRLLEDDLGLALFARAGRSLRLTPAGEQLQEAAGAAFARIHSTVAALHRNPAPAALVLGCPGSVLARWMIPRLDKLARDLPQLTLHLSAQEGGFEPQLPGLDAALLLGEQPWPADWQVHELAGESIGPVVSPHYVGLAGLQQPPPAALLGEPLLHTASRPQAWPNWARRNGLDPALLRYGTGFEHLYYLLEAAVAGMGVAIAPRQLVSSDLAAGRLLAPWGFTDTDGSWALCAPKRANDQRIGVLAGWLRQQLSAAT
jgi:DNA-binding transcriptional LysR family regulator